MGVAIGAQVLVPGLQVEIPVAGILDLPLLAGIGLVLGLQGGARPDHDAGVEHGLDVHQAVAGVSEGEHRRLGISAGLLLPEPEAIPDIDAVAAGGDPLGGIRRAIDTVSALEIGRIHGQGLRLLRLLSGLLFHGLGLLHRGGVQLVGAGLFHYDLILDRSFALRRESRRRQRETEGERQRHRDRRAELVVRFFHSLLTSFCMQGRTSRPYAAARLFSYDTSSPSLLTFP